MASLPFGFLAWSSARNKHTSAHCRFSLTPHLTPPPQTRIAARAKVCRALQRGLMYYITQPPALVVPLVVLCNRHSFRPVDRWGGGSAAARVERQHTAGDTPPLWTRRSTPMPLHTGAGDQATARRGAFSRLQRRPAGVAGNGLARGNTRRTLNTAGTASVTRGRVRCFCTANKSRDAAVMSTHIASLPYSRCCLSTYVLYAYAWRKMGGSVGSKSVQQEQQQQPTTTDASVVLGGIESNDTTPDGKKRTASWCV